MASVKLKFRLIRQNDKEGVIYYQIAHQRKIRRIYTDYKIRPCEWDDEKECITRPLPRYSRYRELLSIIEKVTRDMHLLQNIIMQYDMQSKTYSVDEIAQKFHLRPTDGKSFLEYARKNIDRIRKSGSQGTASNRMAMLNSFMNYRKWEDVSLPKMTAEMMEEYEGYLKARGNCRNTTSFYMRALRSIYNQAVEERVTEHHEMFNHVSNRADKTIKRALPIQSIKRIKGLDLSQHHTLETTRDLFLFSFYTRGMSFIDMAYLKKKNLTGELLVYRRHKTGQQLQIRWEKEMQEIIDKHPNHTQYLLPIILDENGQEYRQYRNAMMLANRKLKKIGWLAGISHNLSMYTARHSWATIARDKNIPLHIISKGLGHENEVNTQIYLASIRTEEIDRANRKIIHELL